MNYFRPTTHIAPERHFKISGCLSRHVSSLTFSIENEQAVLFQLESSYVYGWTRCEEQGLIRYDFTIGEYILPGNLAELQLLASEINFAFMAPTFRGAIFAALVCELTSLSLWTDLTTEQVKLIAYTLAQTPYNPMWEQGIYDLTLRQRETLMADREQASSAPISVRLEDREPVEEPVCAHDFAELARMFGYYAAYNYSLEIA